MTVYLAIRHFTDEGADVESVYATLDTALAAYPAEWAFTLVQDGDWEYRVTRDERVTIARHEVQP